MISNIIRDIMYVYVSMVYMYALHMREEKRDCILFYKNILHI